MSDAPAPADQTRSAIEAALANLVSNVPPEDVVRALRALHHDLLQRALAPDETLDGKGKRREPRQRSLRLGRAVYNNRACVVSCQIRDISTGGCRLRLPNTTCLPTHFELQITGLPEIKHCEVRWRSQSEIGVRFIPVAPAASGKLRRAV